MFPLPALLGRGALHCSKMEQWNILEQTAIHFQPRKMELIGFKGEEEVSTAFYRGWLRKVDSSTREVIATRGRENYIPPLLLESLLGRLHACSEDGI